MSNTRQGTGQQASAPVAARQKTVMSLIRTAEDLRRYFTALYAPHDITPQQYNVLRILRGADPTPLPTMEIAERMVEKTPGITRLLDRLERKGLIGRERLPEDRRQVLVSITEAGLELVASLDEPVLEATSAVLWELGDGEVSALDDTLARIRECIAAVS